MEKNFFSASFLSLLFYFCSCTNSDTAKTPGETNTAPAVKSVFINGDSLHYIDVGKGNPVVFVHGSLGDYRAWEAQMDTFAKSHRVIAYSRRFAYPNKQVINDSADYTVPPHAKDLGEFLKALNLQQVHLVGHSFGAFTALLTAIDHPERVRSLTLGEPPVMSLLQTVPGGDTMANHFVRNTAIPTAEAFHNNNNEKAASTFISGVMGDSLYFSRLSARNREIIMANTLETRGSVFTKNLFPPVSCEDLKKIKAPVLVLEGERSPLFVISINRELERCLRNSEKATFPNTSHGLQFESPDAFNKTVLAFLKKHD